MSLLSNLIRPRLVCLGQSSIPFQQHIACLHSSSSSSTTDLRPPSAQQFSTNEIQTAISYLSSQGYDRDAIWEQRVIWGDHDQFQHVNNAHFVKWFESSRMFWAEKITHHLDRPRQLEILQGTGSSLILAHLSIRYRRPVTYPDTILIGQACELPFGKDRFNLRSIAYSLKQKSIVAICRQDIVTYDYKALKKCDIPQDIKQALEARGTQFNDVDENAVFQVPKTN